LKSEKPQDEDLGSLLPLLRELTDRTEIEGSNDYPTAAAFADKSRHPPVSDVIRAAEI